jgi:uncharacterized protein YyaL (SSP411 family)
MTNALANETSPYLRQHQHNPVDWLPWGPVALNRARDEDRPLLVSIGYSACHWCHVMERESFEDAETAALMNEHFVCVKVDREERPDIDAIYIEAVQGLTGQGGWPLNVFLTPDQAPFFGGTYFPPEPRMGMASWRQVLEAVANAWRDKRAEIREQGDRVAEALAGAAALKPSGDDLDPALRERAVEALVAQEDRGQGGWGRAPKFPSASVIRFLLARGETEAGVRALRAMASGGIYDQVGGGFSRYSVDAQWVVPHFEKMLYDNALLARSYLHGWLVTRDELLRRTCEETLDWALREMRGPEGGFYSALDADSEGVEGKYYVWSLAELRELLGDDADAAIAHFEATARGNFEGANILTARGPALDDGVRERVRAALLQAREGRVRPGLDDKRLCSWNALMISALADAGAVLARPDYVAAAVAAAEFVWNTLRDANGRLLRSYNAGQAKLDAYLEDHAFALEAMLTLYEATFDARWFAAARELADTLLERFADPVNGGFFSTASDHEPLIARRKDLDDAPIPSGGASAAFGLLRLAALTGEERYRAAGEGQLRLTHVLAQRHPTAFGHTLQALDFLVGPVREVALVGPSDGVAGLAATVREQLRPRLVLAGGPGPAPEPPLLADREPVDGRAAAYVCEQFVCQRPITAARDLAAALQ